jgi:hypothetical protein
MGVEKQRRPAARSLGLGLVIELPAVSGLGLVIELPAAW